MDHMAYVSMSTAAQVNPRLLLMSRSTPIEGQFSADCSQGIVSRWGGGRGEELFPFSDLFPRFRTFLGGLMVVDSPCVIMETSR